MENQEVKMKRQTNDEERKQIGGNDVNNIAEKKSKI